MMNVTCSRDVNTREKRGDSDASRAFVSASDLARNRAWTRAGRLPAATLRGSVIGSCHMVFNSPFFKASEKDKRDTSRKTVWSLVHTSNVADWMLTSRSTTASLSREVSEKHETEKSWSEAALWSLIWMSSQTNETENLDYVTAFQTCSFKLLLELVLAYFGMLFAFLLRVRWEDWYHSWPVR